jgi:enoyl-CoA hydratase/carnithine racemase
MASTIADDVVLLAHDGPVAIITINRPRAMNAL